jgi:dTDP-4-amino-4,6-dideoxygalactose transaminase
MKKVNLFWPNIHKELWLEELGKIFDSKWIAQAGKVKEFETEFGKKFDYDYCVALNSGTAALELAFYLLNLKPGDFVLTPVLTCTATNIPLVRKITSNGILFIDINENLSMNWGSFIENIDRLRMIGVKPKAVVTVNLGGITCDDRIYEYCRENNIPVVVDACQSLGIKEPNGDFVCYSFQAIKHFTTGDGGMLICRNEKDYERAKKLRWFGIDRDMRAKKNFDFSPSDREMCMNMDEPGFKYHMNDIQATMGLVGLGFSDENLEFRKKLSDRYIDKLCHKFTCISGGSYWLFAILMKNRDKYIDEIKKQGVECDLIHLRNDIFTPFGGKRQILPNMDRIEREYLYLPMHINMTLDDVNYVSDVILKTVKE